MAEKFSILVTIKLKPGMAEEFRRRILKNAEASVREEPDCHQFQVLTAIDEPDTFIFYEVYTDEAALERHRQQPHFLEFIEATRDMVASRSRQRCSVINA
jgi:(4S)-4-hydroxy-5-phosphonooxypentane-2,3-dione isomerase